MTETNPDQPARVWFHQELRSVLGSLYDTSALSSSPLTALLGADQSADTVSTLRQILLDAIESLRPSQNLPKSSRPSRIYEILRHRFTEQQTQFLVADIISLSVRQLQREEKSAVIILADHLWRIYHLEDKVHSMTARLFPANTSEAEKGHQEHTDMLEWDNLISTIPFQQSSIVEMIKDVSSTLQSVADAAQVSIDLNTGNERSQLYLQAPILKQGLLNLLNTAIELAPGGKVFIQTTAYPGEERITIQATAETPKQAPNTRMYRESLDIAEKLVRACKGSLTVSVQPDEVRTLGKSYIVFDAAISLPSRGQTPILVVEDNADTRQLYQRYLADSRYRFIGARDVRQGMHLAEEVLPGLIILDVMMPESDGWALLGQLRVHPKTSNIPVIICSVIPQTNLAMTLGAAGFLHKPVSRADLLAALDQQMEQKQIKPG